MASHRADPVDTGADFDDDPHVLVAEDHPVVEICPALIRMKVRPADVGGSNPDDRVERLLDLRVSGVVDRHVARTMKNP